MVKTTYLTNLNNLTWAGSLFFTRQIFTRGLLTDSQVLLRYGGHFGANQITKTVLTKWHQELRWRFALYQWVDITSGILVYGVSSELVVFIQGAIK